MINLGPGNLYFSKPDGSYSEFGEIYDAEITTDDYDQEVIKHVGELEASFEMVARISKEAMLDILGIKNAIIQSCPNKRVVHLLLNTKKHRTRKKNINRAIRILEGTSNE